MLLGAWLIWVLALVAIHFEFGWASRSEGPPLAILATFTLVVYLTSGVTLSIDRAQDVVRTRWRLLGIPLWTVTRRVALETVELRAAWMHRTRGRTVVYDLLMVGHDPGAGAEPVELALVDDLAIFRFAEARARATAGALRMPLVVRWNAVLDEVPTERREPDDLARALEAPPALGHWSTRIWRRKLRAGRNSRTGRMLPATRALCEFGPDIRSAVALRQYSFRRR